MANAKRKFSQIDDSGGNNISQTQPEQIGSDRENGNATAQQDALNAHNNETNDTGIATDEASGHITSRSHPSTTSTAAESANNGNNGLITAKQTRKRRRKGEPEPNHTATVVEKARKMKRVPQACDRCHVRRFRCDNGPHGCYKCLSSGYMCTVTDRNTGRPRVRGGGDGIVVNFDQVQVENEELKTRNREQSQRIDELQNEIGHLRGQLQCYQNPLLSIGATNTPNYAPVSMSSGVYFNPRAMHQSHPALNHAPPFAPHNSMNNNAFSGNMSIQYNPNIPNIPHGNTMPNAASSSQWHQPSIHQGFPLPPHSHLMTQAYNPYYSQAQVSPIPAQRRITPSQNSLQGQGMVHPGMPIPSFHPESWQARAPHQLLMPQSLDNSAMNVSNQHIPIQASQNKRDYFQQTGPAIGTGAGEDADLQNQNSQNLTGLGIHYPSAQVYQGMNGIQNNHIHDPYNSQMIPSQHLRYRAQGTNTQPQGMRPTSVTREGHYQDPSVSAYNAGMQNQNYQNQLQHQPQDAIAQIQDHHHQNLPVQQEQQQSSDLPPNPSMENNTIAREQGIQQEQLSQSLELLEPILESTSNNHNSEPIVNPDLILPDTGPSDLPTLDDVGGLDLQYNDGFYDIDTEVYNALTQFGNESVVGHEALTWDPLTTNTPEGQIYVPNTNNQYNIANDNNQNQGQTQLEVQSQAQEQGNQDTDLPSFGLYSEEDWFGNSEDGLF